MLSMACVAAFGSCKQYDSPSTQTSSPGRSPNPSTASQATGAPGSAKATVSDQSSHGAGIGVAHGGYLVDATGRTLYALAKDGKGQSSCYDACSTRWPPLLSPQQGTVQTLDPSIKADAIVDMQRTDGAVQVTYQGHPLYHYAQDPAAGQTNGQGIKDQFGEWYMLSPSGEPLDSR